jgi:DNA-binding CsgD family transcriptional regulator
VSSRRFVGRRPQLAELLRALGEAEQSRAGLALVAGESGVGKTRLVDELAVHARERGGRVLTGESVELAEGELPYAPIISALRPLIRSGDPALEAVRAELARPHGASAIPPQGRFFELLLDVFDTLAREAPLVLVLEDIHWADRSTRDFLSFAARNLCRERVLIVATYRTDELHRRHPLRRLLPEIERLDGTALVPVDRLTPLELADLLTDILGAEPDAPLLERMYERCEGNPLFAEELLAASPDGTELPPTLRDALMVRVEALDDATQDLLRVIAAAARADEPLLEEVADLAPAALRPALREGLAHHVLVHGGDGRYAFRHALLREAIHDDLLPGEAVELHLKLARALERRADAGQDDLDTVTAIAHHFSMAGEQPEALGAAVRAADAAEGIHAPAEAAAQLERALALWPRVADAAGRAGLDHARLLERLSEVSRVLGDHDRARHAADRALTEIDVRVSPRRGARLLQLRGRSLWMLGRGEETMASYERGLELLVDDAEPSRERADLLGSKAKTLMLWGRYSEAVEFCERTLAEARACGARDAESNALNTLGVALAGLGDVERGIASLERSIEMDRADGRFDDCQRGYANLSDVLLIAGRVSAALVCARAGLVEFERQGLRSSWNTLQLGEILVAAGQWAEASEVVAPERGPRHVGTLGIFFHVVAGELALGRGETALALEHLTAGRELARTAYDPQWHGPIAALLGEALWSEGRFDEGRAVLADGVARLSQISGLQDHARMARIVAAEVGLEASAAQRARDLGDDEGAAAAVAGARAALQRGRVIEGEPGTRPWLAQAEAEATRAEGVSDPDAWAATAAAWIAIERPYLAAVARWREAEALVRVGDRPGATVAARAALDRASQIGSPWLVDEVSGLGRRARLRLDDGDGPADGPLDDVADGGGDDDPIAALGLTPREGEVLVLLAEGRTNREIGETLFMAEKTASVHVSRILAKLDVRSRTEAAAVAHRLGLAVGLSEPAR